MNTACATAPSSATEIVGRNINDSSAWVTAGQTWCRGTAAGSALVPAEVRVGRIALVNCVLGAVKRFDCGLCSDADLAGALHDAVRRFNQRAA